jgi:hypothetical protein
MTSIPATPRPAQGTSVMTDRQGTTAAPDLTVYAEQIRCDMRRCLAQDLNLLREFVHLADVGSLPAAATDLGYVPADLERRMAAMEHHLGACVITFEAQAVRPTDCGNRLLPYLRAALATVDALRGWPAPDPPSVAGHERGTAAAQGPIAEGRGTMMA